MNKLLLTVGKNTWFVSDTHFNHIKLTQSCEDRFENCRKYFDSDEMNGDIIEQWNLKIKPNDTVIFCGDFILNIRYSELPEEFHRLMSILNGKKYFIMGNHDYALRKKLKGEVEFYDYAILNFNGKNYFVQHRDFNENTYFLGQEIENGLDLNNTVLIHGHTHDSLPWKNCDFFGGKKMNNVCWDAWYRPVNITELD